MFSRRAKWQPTLALAALLLLPESSFAEDACTVRIVAPRGSRWERAARELLVPPEDGDCARVVVKVEGEGARVTFTTRDGRQAERTVREPSELGPTIDALRVTVPVAPSEASPAPAPPLEAPAPVRTERPAAAEPRAPVVLPEPSGVIFGAMAGARGGADRLMSPVLGGFASFGLGRWELGVHGRWEMYYHEIGDAGPTTHRSEGMAAGVSVGRREPMGNVLTLAFGGSLMLAVIHDELNADGRDGRGREFAEPRLGGYIGVVLPRRSRTRFRADLGGEVVPTRLGESTVGAAGWTILPWWALALSVGVEVGGS